jgi:site-specific DNA recombinase
MAHTAKTRTRRAVVAARISNLTDESVSIARQIKAGKAYATSREWDVVGYVKDEDVSASKTAPMDRKDLRAWLDRADEWDVLIFWKLDRVVRSPADLTDMIRWCEEHGKSLVFVEDGFDLTNDIGQAMAYIAAVFARMEVRNTSKRLIDANKELRTTKRWQSGRPPYGFMSIPAEDGKGRWLVHDPVSHPVMREMGLRVLDRQSRNSIAIELSERGVHTPSDHALVRAGKESTGYRWTAAIVDDRLRSPSTQGIKMHKGKPVLGPDGMPLQIADPTFTDAEWSEIQVRLDETSQATGIPVRSAGALTPYLGVLVCKCGVPLYRAVDKKLQQRRKTLNDRYYCRNPKHKAMSVKTEEVNRLFGTLLLSAYGEQPRMRKVFVPGEDHTAELERVKAAIERLRDDREAGDYDGDEDGYRSRMDRLRVNRDRLAAMPHRPDGWMLEDTGEKWADWWRSADEKERRDELIRAGVRVYYLKDPKTMSVEIGFLSDPEIPGRLADPSAKNVNATGVMPPAEGDSIEVRARRTAHGKPKRKSALSG